MARLRSIRSCSGGVLSFSPPVYEAIVRTGCYEYAGTSGKVVEADLKRARALRNVFERTLEKRELKTVSEWLGYYQGMIEDPLDLRRFAENYDRTRRASKEVLLVLRKHLAPDPQKTGLEIGCGTGNYSVPFADEFGTIIGLDISDEMLTIARQKSSGVTWICANALNNSDSTIPSGT